MKKLFFIKHILLFIVSIILSFNDLSGQCNNGGNQNGGHGSGGSAVSRLYNNFIDAIITVVRPIDPNDILGPNGYEVKKWMSINDKLSFTVRFENDPKQATAPAHNVFVRVPVDDRFNINSFRLGKFGFGRYTFEAPQSSTYYSTRLDLTDSLGIYVDFIGGIDIVKNELFWTFRTIEPETGQPPTDPFKGFLKVNDTAAKTDSLPGPGEGFVSFHLVPDKTIATGDTTSANATIVFDTEQPIATNTWVNTIDALPPVSSINSFSSSSDTIQLQWAGQDDAGGSGVRDYALFVSEDSSAFMQYGNNIKETSIHFVGTPGRAYRFFTQAVDNTGNKEALKGEGEVEVRLGGCKPEVCGNGKDDDCDGLVDEGCTQTVYYRDNDKDGFGDKSNSTTAGAPPAGYVEDNRDCNDADKTVYPGAPELCDGKDNDCDNQVDEDIQLVTYYRDADGDGYGVTADAKQSCSPMVGYATRGGDCEDTRANVYPGASEVCDGLDNNCNNVLDEGVKTTYYQDSDGDGFGSSAKTQEACEVPAGYSDKGGDCNDNDKAIYPGAQELCDNKDNDCDGTVDEGVKITYYKDADKDSYGDPAQSTQACSAPQGYVTDNKDCNDNNAQVNPGIIEVCGNGIDDNCDGQTDEGCQNRALLNINDVTVYESQGVAMLTVSLTRKMDVDVKVNYSTVNGTARSKGTKTNPADYTAASGSLTIPAGVQSVAVSITIINSPVVEPTEDFTVQLSRPINVAIDKGVGTVTILDGAASAIDPALTRNKPVEQNKHLEIGTLRIKAQPNPSQSQFTLSFEGAVNGSLNIRVLDNMGRIMEARSNVGSSITLGSNYHPGVYYVEATKGAERKLLKLVKQ